MSYNHYVYTALKLVACNAAGFVFGFAAEKGKGTFYNAPANAYTLTLCFSVYVPGVIREQMLFSQFTMVKVFLSAVTAGRL